MIWKPVPGWPRYEVSDKGDVRSCAMQVRARGDAVAVRKGRRLKGVVKTNGYICVSLTDGTKVTQMSVHSLVARCFIGERPKGAHILHSDGNRENNELSNLRYGTAAENVADTEKHGRRRRGANHPAARLTEACVRAIRASSASPAQLAPLFGVTGSHICAIKNGRVWRHLGDGK